MKKLVKYSAPVSYTHLDDSLYEKWTDFSLRHFPKDKKKLLELACGAGIQSIYFKQAGFDVTGLDPVSYTHLDVYKRQIWTPI